MFLFHHQVLGFGLFLLDGKDMSINKLDGKRKLNLGKIDRIFKVRYSISDHVFLMSSGR